jgi:quinoprotein glucose dehydrogenase
LRKITTDNAKDLKLAWQFETGDKKRGDDPDEFTSEDPAQDRQSTLHLFIASDCVRAGSRNRATALEV